MWIVCVKDWDVFEFITLKSFLCDPNTLTFLPFPTILSLDTLEAKDSWKIMSGKRINPPNLQTHFITSAQKTFENIVEQGGIAQSEQFFLFPQYFQVY